MIKIEIEFFFFFPYVLGGKREDEVMSRTVGDEKQDEALS